MQWPGKERTVRRAVPFGPRRSLTNSPRTRACRSAGRFRRVPRPLECDLVIVPHDLRHSLRLIRKAPGFSGIVIALMALGIAANAAVFTAVNGILLRPLPYRNTAGLMVLRENGPAETSRGMRTGVPDFVDWRAQATAFTDMAAYAPIGFNVAVDGEVERSQAQVVSHNFARVLGVQPALGRFFAPED